MLRFDWLPHTIVSGGQTGADRAALDWACRHSIMAGGGVTGSGGKCVPS